MLVSQSNGKSQDPGGVHINSRIALHRTSTSLLHLAVPQSPHLCDEDCNRFYYPITFYMSPGIHLWPDLPFLSHATVYYVSKNLSADTPLLQKCVTRRFCQDKQPHFKETRMREENCFQS